MWQMREAPRPNRFDTVEHRLRFLISVLQAHPNLVSLNLLFQRNLLGLLAHMPDLAQRLGTHLGSLSPSHSSDAPIDAMMNHSGTGGLLQGCRLLVIRLEPPPKQGFPLFAQVLQDIFA